MRNLFDLGSLACLALAGCASNGVCDKNEALDWASKQGDCGGEGRPVLDSKAACTTGVNSCSGDDQKALEVMLDCLAKLPVCSQAARDSWVSSRQACYDGASRLSASCKSAFFGGASPGEDGGDGGGAVDAGPQPMTDGGGAIDLIVVADETDFALAWTSRQPGDVAHWRVASVSAADVSYPDQTVEGALWTYHDADAGQGVKKGFFVAGLNSADQIVLGVLGGPDAGPAADAGGCTGPLDCALDKVCNLGACAAQVCQNSNTCPGGYLCDSVTQHLCVRIFGLDAGAPDAGGPVDAGEARPLPFLSERVTATTAAPGVSAETFVSPFASRNPAIVAIDSARQYVALEQEGQLFGHLTLRRGADYPLDGVRRPSQIDSIGTHVKLAYQAENGTLFACYNVGSGVRVRVSRDLGQTWGGPAEALDVAYPTPDDGGVAPLIQDCALAPWRDGQVAMVTLDDSSLVVRTVSDALAAGPAEQAFISSGPDAGNIFNARRPAIATLPATSALHVGFTATRAMAPPSSGMDTEVYAVYRDPTTGGVFTQPVRINATGVGSSGNPTPQDHVALATDPVTQKAIAAFTSLESQGGVAYNTVYVSLFVPGTKSWITSGDLNVFAMRPPPQNTEFVVIPDRPLGSAWDAFSPTLAVTPGGKVFLSFVAGDHQVGQAADYHGYVVGFDWKKLSPLSGALAWFLPPAKRLGSTVVVDPRAGGNTAQPTQSASAADSQLSVYTVYVEGLGAAADEPNRAIVVARP